MVMWSSIDVLRLKQVVINILSNAFKYTKRGTVEIVVNMSDDPKHQGLVCIEIRDTGSGIPTELISKLFQKSEIRQFDGAGLGLVLSYHMVLAMDGRYFIRSSTLSFMYHLHVLYIDCISTRNMCLEPLL
jgi:signal transduction histidine kinase